MKVFEDSIQILAAEVIPTPLTTPVGPTYPQISLALGPQEKEIELPLIWLSNEFTQIAIAPSLGGRIFSIRDLRTDTEIIPIPDRLPLTQTGIRGVELNWGVEFLAGPDRRDRLAHLDYRIKEAGDAEGKIAVFLHGWAGDISWHGVVTLRPNDATIGIEQKIQNRAWNSNPARAGLTITLFQPDAGLHFVETTSVLSANPDQTWSTAPKLNRLGGHRFISWSGNLVPHSNSDEKTVSSESLTVSLSSSELSLQAHRPLKDHKIFLSVSGQTLESKLDLPPGIPAITPLASIPGTIEGIAIRNAAKETILTWPPTSDPIKSVPIDFPHIVLDSIAQNPAIPPQELLRMPGLEPLGYYRLALQSIADQNPAAADTALENLTGFLAEDPFTWWLKAAIRRELGGDPEEEDLPDLPNAHYLAPLEPLLKAEAFLNTPQAAGPEPNPLLTSIAAHPEQAAGVVAAYLDCLLPQSMARLADELLRHRENPLVRYLYAFGMLRVDRLQTTAAEQVQLAEKAPVEPPFPQRQIEVEAIQTLHRRFPEMPRLAQINAITESAIDGGHLNFGATNGTK